MNDQTSKPSPIGAARTAATFATWPLRHPVRAVSGAVGIGKGAVALARGTRNKTEWEATDSPATVRVEPDRPTPEPGAVRYDTPGGPTVPADVPEPPLPSDSEVDAPAEPVTPTHIPAPVTTHGVSDEDLDDAWDELENPVEAETTIDPDKA